jgi:hypothetical protein
MRHKSNTDVSGRQTAANNAVRKSLSDADDLIWLRFKVTESADMIKKLRKENNFALRMRLAYRGCE